jgi:hypothetical protein
MHVAFLTPLAALAVLLAGVPVVSWLAARARDRRARVSLRVPSPRWALQFAVPVAIVLTLALVAVAAAQPVIQHGVPRRARIDAQAYFVFDISRSMSASPTPRAPTRLDRAKRFAAALRPRLAAIPVGVATLTDRVLPVEFPTADESSFASVVQNSIQIDEPGPQRFYADRATTYAALAQFADEAYFDATARHRAIVVLTDGESQPVSPALADSLRRRPGVSVVFVHVARADDRVYATALPDPNYRPDPGSGAFLARMASVLHGASVSESDVGGAARAVRRALGTGPVKTVQEPARFALMPYVTLAAFLPLAFVLWRRNLSALPVLTRS